MDGGIIFDLGLYSNGLFFFLVIVKNGWIWLKLGGNFFLKFLCIWLV